jgi:hypothetical protein
MRDQGRNNAERSQALIELAVTLPVLLALLVGLVQVVMIAHNYLVVLEASREGARLGARGAAYFSNDEIRTLVEQNLSRGGYTSANGLEDIIIVRAEVGPGVSINHYEANRTLGSSRPMIWTQAKLASSLDPSDPHSRLVIVEIHHDHRSIFLPNPIALRVHSTMRIIQ